MTSATHVMLENDDMPKVLVLFAESSAAPLAERAAAGAKTIRFTEVDVRSVGLYEATTGTHHKSLESAHAAEHYDGVIITVSDGATPATIETLLDAWDRAAPDAFANTVFATTGSDHGDLLLRVAQLGGIVVTAPRGEMPREERAGLVGQRTAKVVEWVRHALSHEHGHHHHAH